MLYWALELVEVPGWVSGGGLEEMGGVRGETDGGPVEVGGAPVPD